MRKLFLIEVHVVVEKGKKQTGHMMGTSQENNDTDKVWSITACDRWGEKNFEQRPGCPAKAPRLRTPFCVQFGSLLPGHAMLW